jgi:hypothetical protein
MTTTTARARSEKKIVKPVAMLNAAPEFFTRMN